MSKGRPRKKNIDVSEWENIVELYNRKVSLKRLADMYGSTPYIVRQILRINDVKIRQRGRIPYKTPAPAKPDFSYMTKPLGGSDD